MTDLGSNLAPDVVAAPQVRKPKTIEKPATVRIVLEENEDIPPSGLFIGINGRGYLLRPGEEAEVPRAIIEVLNNAITSVPQRDPATQQVLGTRDKMRYSYRIIN